MFRDFVRTTWTILRKDLAVLFRQPLSLVATFVPPLCFLLVAVFGSAAIGRSPVALVALDHSFRGTQMQQIFRDADAFRITNTTAEQAQALFKNIQVVAIITIPADFTQRVEAHQVAPIDVKINNLNMDFTNDIRQEMSDAITQFYQMQGKQSAIKITSQEQNLHQQNVSFFQYSVVPIIVMLLIITGIVNGGLSTAREWESRTVKELLLSPASGSAIIMGKVLAGFITTLLMGGSILVVSDLFGLVYPVGIYWLNALVTIALIALIGSGIGVALGARLQRPQPVIGLGINIALYLFLCAGGIGVLAFMTDWLQNIAAFVPLTYGRHALEMAVFYDSSALFGRDALILGVCALAAVGLGTLAVRREITN